jgi:hypothetical protein
MVPRPARGPVLTEPRVLPRAVETEGQPARQPSALTPGGDEPEAGMVGGAASRGYTEAPGSPVSPSVGDMSDMGGLWRGGVDGEEIGAPGEREATEEPWTAGPPNA